VHDSASCWPELAENSEQGRFAAPVRSSDHHVHAWRDFERHVWNKNVRVRRQNWHIFEDDVVTVNDLGSSSRARHHFLGLAFSAAGDLVCLRNHDALVAALA